jgi:NAD-dependent DNA ligase
VVPSQQLELLHSLGFIPVYHTHIKHNNLTDEILKILLQDRRTHSPYEIDGIIVSADVYKPVAVNGNPDHAFAFKNTIDSATSTVTEVVWNPSKDGRLVPVVNFEPVKLSGVTITKATGHNGDFIKTFSIGKGAVVEIMRSGDVIPYIKSVPTPAATPSMPTVPYTWNGKDIFTTEDSDEQNISLLENFFRKADIPNMRLGNITKLYNAGHKTIGAMSRLKAGDISMIEGIGTKTAEVLAVSLASIKDLPCRKLMDASNAFGRGFGEKRLELFLDKFPKALDDIPSLEEVINLKGVSEITGKAFIEGLQTFREWQVREGISCSSIPTTQSTSKLVDQVIVFTGFRDVDLKKQLESNGATVSDNISKKTTMLVTKTKGETSTKTDKAQAMGVQIISKDELLEML